MCGFAGVALSRNPASVSKWATDSILHRGPDEQDSNFTDSHGVFFARLAIVGIKTGRQPFVDSESRTVVSVNGEIYNHEVLRKELEDRGFSFETDSDGEVVLWGYLAWGTEIFSRLEGMFAVAIFDARSQALVLGRDPIGEKPLYWRREVEGIQYCSEAGGLMPSLSGFSSRQLHRYLLSDSLGWGREYGSEVENVRPGTHVTLTKNSCHEEAFYELPEINRSFVFSPKMRDRSIRRLREALERSTHARLMSDVPVGVFLSGGVDSQLVTAIASRVGGIECAYTLKFQRDSFDESSEAIGFADGLGLPVKVVDASVDSLADVWTVLKDTIDEPFADSAILPQMLLAREAATSTKVVLSGDGGDELFMGYQHVVAHQIYASRLTANLVHASANVVAKSGVFRNDDYFSGKFKVERLVRAGGLRNLVRRDLSWRSAHTAEMASSLLPAFDFREVDEEYARIESELLNPRQPVDWRSDWTRLYLRGYLPEIILRKVDRATMRFGVESRPPLLDRNVIAEVLALPMNHRYTPFRPKALPTDLLRSYIPKASRSRRKHGMGIPLTDLLSGPLKPDVSYFLGRDFIEHQGLFSSDAVAKLRTSFEGDGLSLSRAVWSLLIFQAWWERLSNVTHGGN